MTLRAARIWPTVLSAIALCLPVACDDLETLPASGLTDAGTDVTGADVTTDVTVPDAADTSTCTEGATRDIPCDQDGTQHQICDSGAWINDGACAVLPLCLTDGSQRLAPCASIPGALQPEKCSDGHWRPFLGCIRSWQWDGSQNDIARSITVAPDGNVLVAGLTMGSVNGQPSAGHVDPFVIKLSPTGKLLWTSQWGSPGADAASAIAVDESGNAYVVGYAEGDIGDQHSLGDSDAFITKLSPDGDILWTRFLGTSTTDGATAISAAPDGTMLVTGYTFGDMFGHTSLGKQDVFLAAIRPDGTTAWSRLWGTSADDSGTGVVADASGNITLLALTGGILPNSMSHGSIDFALVAMDKHGKVQQQALFGSTGDDSALGLALSNKPGHVFVSGFTYSALPGYSNLGELDAFVTGAYVTNPMGVVLEHTEQFGTNNFDLDKGITVTSAGEVFSCGDSYGPTMGGAVNAGEFDIFVAQHAPGTRRVALLGTGANDQCHAIASSKRTLWLAGHAGGRLPTSSSGHDGAIVVVRIDLPELGHR